MRVAMIGRDYPPTIGGIATYSQSLVDNLRSLGVEVDVYAGRSDARTVMIPLADRRYRSTECDLVHVQSAPYGPFVRRHPLVVTVHSPVLEERKFYGFGRWLKSPIAHFFEKLSLGNAEAVICVSEATRSILLSRYTVEPEKISVIPNGVDCDKFRPGTRGACPKVLICSRLDERKNISVGLEALAEAGPQCELNIVGDGPERPKLTKLAERVGLKPRFWGALPREDLYPIFGESSVFISTSLSEGFGLSLLEAMAAGCVAVASDIPPHREFVKHSENGFLFSSKAQLVEELSALLADPDMIRRIGEAARMTALRYSWVEVASRTLALYRKLTG